MKFASDVLPPILLPAQRVGYGRTLSIVVIVIAARARACSARREDVDVAEAITTPPSKDSSLQPIVWCSPQPSDAHRRGEVSI